MNNKENLFWIYYLIKWIKPKRSSFNTISLKIKNERLMSIKKIGEADSEN